MKIQKLTLEILLKIYEQNGGSVSWDEVKKLIKAYLKPEQRPKKAKAQPRQSVQKKKKMRKEPRSVRSTAPRPAKSNGGLIAAGIIVIIILILVIVGFLVMVSGNNQDEALNDNIEDIWST